MGTPPNPFDQAAVDAYLAEQEQKQASKEQARRGEQPERDVAPFKFSATGEDPAVEAQVMLDYWAGRGPEVYAEALGAIASVLDETAEGLEAAGTDDDMAPAALTATALGKRLREASSRLYDAGRGALWHWVGQTPGARKLEDGRTFKFTSNPRMTRSTNYKKLQENYPEAYRAAVKETPADLTKPGRLTL